MQNASPDSVRPALQSATGAIPLARPDGPGVTGFVRKQSWAALLREAT